MGSPGDSPGKRNVSMPASLPTQKARCRKAWEERLPSSVAREDTQLFMMCASFSRQEEPDVEIRYW
jgi:hypothetical protein